MKAVYKSNIACFTIIFAFVNASAQVSTAFNNGTSSDYVGWDNSMTSDDLFIKHEANKAIQFWTDGNYRARIGNTGEFSLIVGNGSFNTLFNNIDIDATGAAPACEGYNYGGSLILAAPNFSNTMVGLSAGSNTNAGVENTMVGYNAGNSNTDGTQNVFVGGDAGFSNYDASYNSFVGYSSGYANYEGHSNTFNGAYSGNANYDGSYNTFSGIFSGMSNTSGNWNTFSGSYSGFDNAIGLGNSFYGYKSGYNNEVDSNTFLGLYSGYSNTTGIENTFTGTLSGYSNTTGRTNNFFGNLAGVSNTTGSYNSFMGSNSGYSNITGEFNTFMGANSGYNNTYRSYNTFIGASSGFSNTSGENNTFVGYSSGLNNNGGAHNTFIGSNSGKSNLAAHGNTFIGSRAGLSNTASSNTFVGSGAGEFNTTGYYNSFFGAGAGANNTDGYYNCFFGLNAGVSNYGDLNSCFGIWAGSSLRGDSNTFMGAYSGTWLYDSDANTALGNSSLRNLTYGHGNTAIGTLSGSGQEIADYNTFVGYRSGLSNTTGESNTFLGKDAGFYNDDGNFNTYIGYNSGQLSTGSHSLEYSIAIGSNAIVRNNQHMILGDNDINVGIGLSNDAIGPRDKLEIKSGTAGVSGLQFYNVTSSTTTGGTASVFLTVDNAGKVILKDVPGGGGSVNACTTVAFAGDIGFIPRWNGVTPVKEICKSQIYDDGTNVGVGFGSGIPTKKFSVNGDINLPLANAYHINGAPFMHSNGNDVKIGFNAGPTGTPGSFSIYIGEGAGNSIAGSEPFNTFVGFEAGQNTVSAGIDQGERNVYIGSKAGQGIGSGQGSNNVFMGHASAGPLSPLNDGNRNIVIGAQAGNSNYASGSDNIVIGYQATVDGGGTGTISNAVVIGGYAFTTSNNAFVCGNSTNQILMGYTATPTSATGGTVSSSDCKLYVNPRSGSSDAAYFNGNVLVGGTVFQTSDSLLKDSVDVLTAESAIEILNQIQPRSYVFNQAGASGLNLPAGKQYGLIADEVELILPGLVKEITTPPISDSSGLPLAPEKTFKTVNYIGFIPLLLSTINKQQELIDILLANDSLKNSRLDLIEQRITNCCQPGSLNRTEKPVIDIVLSNSIILNQNDPNPFAEETRITYNIPEGVIDAKIIFFDNANRIVQTVKIHERGEGELHVYAGNLSSGIYSYSLIADGKIVDTKKMVCTK